MQKHAIDHDGGNDHVLFFGKLSTRKYIFHRSTSFILLTALSVPTCFGQAVSAKTPTSSLKPVAKPPEFATRGEVDELKRQLENLTKQISDLQAEKKSSDEFMYQVWFDVSKLKKDSAELDPASPNTYIRVESDVGPLLVSLENAEPYLDGYKVHLTIGNPLSLTFKGFQIAATWAPRLSGNDYAGWLKKQKKKTFSLTQDLLSGRWNAVTLILPETKAEEVGYLEVSITINTISLGAALGN